MKYQRILQAINDTPWMIRPDKLDAIVGVVEARAAGIMLTASELEEFSTRRKRSAGMRGQVAVLPLFGTICQRIGLMTASGGTSADEFGRDFDRSVADPNVGAILIDVDSPGGSVYGVPELAQKIYDARGSKPILAIANSEAASAAYWIATAADELIVTPGGTVGSVGVIAAHVDRSRANEANGEKVTYVTAGKYKAEGNSDEPLNDEAKEYWQAEVNRYYGMFVDGVAANRGVTARAVKADFGQGRMTGARQAVQLKMADRVATFDEALAELNATADRAGARGRRTGGYTRGASAAARHSGRNAAELRRKLERDNRDAEHRAGKNAAQLRKELERTELKQIARSNAGKSVAQLRRELEQIKRKQSR